MNRITRVRAIFKILSFNLNRFWVAFAFVLLQIFPTGAQKTPDSPRVTYQLCWQFPSDKTTAFTPAAHDNTIFFPASDGELTALNAIDGSVVWRAALGGNFVAAPAANSRAAVFTISQTAAAGENKTDGAPLVLRALSAATGVTIWQTEFPPAAGASLYLHNETILVVVRFANGKQKLTAFSAAVGTARWTSDVAAAMTTELIFADANVYFGAADNSIVSLRLGDGAAGRRYELRRPIRGQLALINGIFVFGDDAGSVTALRQTDARVLWTLRTGGAIQTIVETGRGVLIASLDNFVYLHSLPKGKRRWRRRLPARPVSAGSISPETILLATTGDASAFIAALKNGKIFGQIPLGADNYAAAAPISFSDRLIIPTLKGVSAFTGNNVECVSPRAKPEIKKDAS